MTKKLLAIRLRSIVTAMATSKDKNGNSKNLSKGKIVAYALIYAILIVSLLFIVFSMSQSIAMIFIPVDGADIYYGMFILLSLSVLFIFSIFETKAELFDCKDNDLLLAMPIKSRDIMISRIAAVLIYNYIIEAIIMIPVIISALMFGGSSLNAIGALIAFLIIPFPATALSSGVGYLVHLASVKFARFKNIAIVVLSLAFMALYFIVYYAVMANLNTILDTLTNNAGNLSGVFLVIAAVGSATRFAPISLAVYLVFSVGISTVAGWLISKNYIKLMTASYSSQKAIYREKMLVKKSGFSALVRKEFSKFLSSPTYILNGGLGLIFEIVLALLIVIKGPTLLDIDPSMTADIGISADQLTSFLTPLFAAGLLFCKSMNLISVSSLSLEGKNLWIIKSMPIESSSVLFAKAMPNMILNSVASVLSGLLVAIGLGASFIQYPVYILLPIFGGILFAFLGIIINVLIPKFEFINEAQVIKQSTAAFLSMIVNMLISVVVFAVSLLTASFGIISSYLIMIFLAVLCVVMYLVIKGPITKKYDAL